MAPAVEIEVALVITAGCDGTGKQRKRGDKLLLQLTFRTRMAYAYAPRLSSRLRPQGAKVAAKIYQPGEDALLEAHADRTIDRIFFSKPAEIQFHSRDRKKHAMAFALDLAPADERK